MPSDAINTLQLKITNDASDALKEVDKLINGVDKLKKKVSEKTEPKGLDETKKTLKEIGSKVEELTIKAGYLEKLGKGGSLNKEAQAEKARANYALQYLSTMEKIKKINDDIAKKAEQSANAEKLKAEAPGRRAAMDAADKSTLLNWKYGYLSDKANAELEKGNLSKANDIALQMLQVQERITKEGEKATKAAEKQAKDEEKAAKEAEKAAEAAKKKADAEALAAQKAEEYARAEAEAANAAHWQKFKDTFKGIGSGLASIGASVGKKIIEPFQKAHKAVQRFFSSIARIAFYRLIRSALRELTQGFSEGVKNLYAWSEAFNTKFAPVMDQFKTQMTYLKNGFASMFSPLIEWVVPNVITPLTDALVELFNYIQQAFAVLVGHDYWYKAQKSMQKFGEATKKANIQLAKFDELNNLTESDNGSSDDASGMFTLEKVATEGSIDFFKTLKDSIKNGDWFGVGKLIAEGLNKGVNSVDAKGVASGIAKVINDAFNFLTGFATTLNWANIGNKIGDFFDTIFKKVDWENMGYAIGRIAGGIGTVIINAISKVKIEDVFNAIVKLIQGLFGGVYDALFEDDGYLAKKLGLSLARNLWAAVTYAVDSFFGLLNGSNLSSDQKKIYRSFLGWTEKGMAEFEVAKTVRESVGDPILNYLDGLIEELDKKHEKFLKDISDNLKQQSGSYKTIGYNNGATLMTGIGNGVNGKKKETVAKIPQVFDGVTLVKNGKKIGLTLDDGIKTGIDEGKGKIQTKITESLNANLGAVTESGKKAGQAYIDGVAATIGSYSMTTSSSSGGATTRFAMIKDAMGGFMKFANGGLTSSLSQGTMYVAGEVPGQAEMVGNINGRTGVASGYEITGIRDAIIASGENEDRLLTRLISALERKQLVIAPSAQLGRVMAQSSRMYGAVTG